jgi:alcohol dehydrogenase class IV
MDMNVRTFLAPRTIITGPNCVAQLGAETKKLGASKVLIVTDPGVSAAGMVDRVQKPIVDAGLQVGVYDKCVPEPPMRSVLDAAGICEQGGYDAIVAFGGGSAMDTAKMVAILPGTGKGVEDFVGVDLVPKPGLPVIAIPTTAGTGSEVTKVAIFANEKLNVKQGVSSPHLVPNVALVDPLLTISCPPKVSAASGLDALIHNIEAFTSVNATPITDMYALDGIRLIAKSIRTAVYQGTNVQARYEMALGALYGGLSFGNAGVTAVHALSYPIGGRFHVPHGDANTLMLPWVMEFNMLGCLEKFVEIGQAMGLHVAGLTPREAAQATVEALKQLAQDLEVPQYLSDVNIPESAIEELADGAMGQTRLLVNNPRSLTREDVIEIYKRCAVRPDECN